MGQTALPEVRSPTGYPVFFGHRRRFSPPAGNPRHSIPPSDDPWLIYAILASANIEKLFVRRPVARHLSAGKSYMHRDLHLVGSRPNFLPPVPPSPHPPLSPAPARAGGPERFEGFGENLARFAGRSFVKRSWAASTAGHFHAYRKRLPWGLQAPGLRLVSGQMSWETSTKAILSTCDRQAG